MDIRVGDYLERIAVEAPVPVDAQGLRRLQRAHLFTVPFENLDIHRGVPIELDERAFLDKIVRRRRGGFCYELNGAFAWLLGELGFPVRRLSANVFQRGDWGIDFDHMLLAVDLDRAWLADVGFGDNYLDPLRWVEGRVQEQSVGDFRGDRSPPHGITLRAPSGGDRFEPQYRFEDRAHALADFGPGCRYHQTPESHFSQGTVCSLARPDGRITLRSDRLIETRDGQRRETAVAGEAEWRALLAERFGIVLD